MSRYVLSTHAPDGWEEACDVGRRLFPSTAWQRLVEAGFGCDTAYAWDSDRQSGATFSIFRAGPFRVAYLGFPVGAVLGDDADYLELVRSWQSSSGLAVPVCVRIPVSSLSPDPQLTLPAVRTSETAIADLGSWRLQSASTNIRRDVRKAERAGIECVSAETDADAAAVYRLYAATIVRNRGARRYTPAYFERLVRLSRQHDRLRVLLARKDGRIVAFNVAALDGASGCYLHGGMDIEARDDRPGALLMHEAIRWARDAGGESFNFLSSPVGQDSLVQYKEKWGGTTRDHYTYTARLRAAYAAFRAAEFLYGMLGRR